MKITIVIPVYNEAAALDPCLEAISRQTLKPYEVIVVDNNSTDNTRKVAEKYSFVKIINESRQGVIHARSTGFNAAQGDIIARIDGDTILPPNWLDCVNKVFRDKSVDAVSGVARYYNVALAGLFNAIDLFFRRHLERYMSEHLYLWGANMAIRRRAWRHVQPQLCSHAGIHEDYDLAIHLQQSGGTVRFDERLKAHVSSRRIDVGYLKFLHYVWVSPRTYAEHSIRSRWHMYPIVVTCALGYLPARALHRGYNAQTDSFSLWRMLTAGPDPSPRVDPTAHVA